VGHHALFLRPAVALEGYNLNAGEARMRGYPGNLHRHLATSTVWHYRRYFSAFGFLLRTEEHINATDG
jgi:hypothetical protein